MVDFTIRVVIDPKEAKAGAAAVSGELKSLTLVADRLRNVIRQALIFTGIGVGIKAITDLADAYTQAQNRIRTVTTSSAELHVVMEKLFQVSASTGVNFNTVVETYTRTASAAKNLGRSQLELITFARTLNEAVVLSGASSKEAQGALIQLSQGIGSATLRGQELRSVLTELPAVADIIVAEFNKMTKGANYTRSSLHDLGKEGKITPALILDAFKHATEDIDNRFAHTLPTIQRAIQTLRTNLIKLLGDFNTNTGAQGSFANAILFVADHLDVLGRVVLALGTLLAGYFATVAVRRATIALYELAAAAYANPYIAIAAALVIVVALLIAFGDKLELGNGHLANLQDVALAVVDAVAALGKWLLALVTDILPNFSESLKRVFSSFTIGGFLDATAALIDGWIGLFAGGITAIIGAFKRMGPNLKIVFGEAMNGIIDLIETALNKITGAIDRVTARVGVAGIGSIKLDRIDTSGALAEVSGQSIAQDFKHGFDLSHIAKDIIAAADVRAKTRIADSTKNQSLLDEALKRLGLHGPAIPGQTKPEKLDTFDNIIKKLTSENIALGQNHQQREISNQVLQVEYRLKRSLSPVERERLVTLLSENQLMKDKAKIWDELRQPQEDLVRGQAALNALVAEGKITQEEYNNEIRKLSLAALAAGRDLTTGLKRGLIEVQDQFGDIASLASDTLVGAFQKAEDAIVKFAQTGKFSFSDLIDGIIADLTKLAVRQSITGPLFNLLAGFGQQVLNSFQFSPAENAFLNQAHAAASAPIGFAGGGGFTIGGSGDSDTQPVSFLGTRGEKVNITRNGGSSGEAKVEVNVYNNAPNTQARVEERSDGMGGKSIHVIVDEITAKNINTPGSKTSRAIGSTFALNPSTTSR